MNANARIALQSVVNDLGPAAGDSTILATAVGERMTGFGSECYAIRTLIDAGVADRIRSAPANADWRSLKGELAASARGRGALTEFEMQWAVDSLGFALGRVGADGLLSAGPAFDVSPKGGLSAVASSQPWQPAPTASQAWAAPKWAALLFSVAAVGSFFLPFGALPSLKTGLEKGDSLCAHPGCRLAATDRVGYSFMGWGEASETVGYCEAHKAAPSATVTTGPSRTDQKLHAIMFLLPGVFALYWIGAMWSVFVGDENQPENGMSWNLKFLLLWVPAAAVAVNGAYYWYFLHSYTTWRSV